MSIFCFNNNNNCTGFAVIASVIIGIVAAFLQLTAVVAVTPAFLWVVFGIAVIFILAAFLSAPLIQNSGSRQCVCTALNTVLISALLTVLFAVILLAITFAATSIIGAIIVGLLLLFFSLTLTSAACLVRCITRCNS